MTNSAAPAISVSIWFPGEDDPAIREPILAGQMNTDDRDGYIVTDTQSRLDRIHTVMMAALRRKLSIALEIRFHTATLPDPSARGIQGALTRVAIENYGKGPRLVWRMEKAT